MDAQQQQQRRDGSFYLSEQELQTIIAHPRFSVPMTLVSTRYALYRGRRTATVLTLRFNVQSDVFSIEFMIRRLIHVLDEQFVLGTTLTYCVDYDVVLAKKNSNPKSYYVWRANSNRTFFNEEEELTMPFTHANVIRLCQESARVHVPTLELNFIDSGCVIDGLLTIVFSFIF